MVLGFGSPPKTVYRRKPTNGIFPLRQPLSFSHNLDIIFIERRSEQLFARAGKVVYRLRSEDNRSDEWHHDSAGFRRSVNQPAGHDGVCLNNLALLSQSAALRSGK